MDDSLVLVFLMEGGRVIASEGDLDKVKDCGGWFPAIDPEDLSPFIINLDQVLAVRTIARTKVFKGQSRFVS